MHHPLSISATDSGTALSDGRLVTMDGHRLTVRVSARRRRLGLTIERDGSLTLRVPRRCTREQAEVFVRDSRAWIEEKVEQQQALRPLNPTRRFVEGEIFRYLGRDHRLTLVDSPGETVRMVAGELALDAATAEDLHAARRAVLAWYRQAGQRWAAGRTQPWADRLVVPEPVVEVRDVGRRWGVYRPGKGLDAGRMSLHWAVFQFPPPLIDYVIAHELAHVRVPGHGQDYWRLLRRAIPECAARKAELDELGRRAWLGE